MTELYNSFYIINNNPVNISDLQFSGFYTVVNNSAKISGFNLSGIKYTTPLKIAYINLLENRLSRLTDLQFSGYNTVNINVIYSNNISFSGFYCINNRYSNVELIYMPIFSKKYEPFFKLSQDTYTSKFTPYGFNTVVNNIFKIEKIKQYYIPYVDNNCIDIKIDKDKLMVILLKDGKVVYEYITDNIYNTQLFKELKDIKRILSVVYVNMRKLVL